MFVPYSLGDNRVLRPSVRWIVPRQFNKEFRCDYSLRLLEFVSQALDFIAELCGHRVPKWRRVQAWEEETGRTALVVQTHASESIREMFHRTSGAKVCERMMY